MKRIKAWWNGLDEIDRSFWKSILAALATMAIVGVVLFIVIGTWLNNDTEYRKNAPCSEFAHYSIENLPARCLSHYGIKEVR